MNWRHIWIIVQKEITDTLRDRRTWMAMVIIPILIMPIITLAGPVIFSRQAEKAEASKPNIVVTGQAPALVDFLRRSDFTIVENSADPAADLAAGRVLAVIDVPGDFEQALAAERIVPITIRYDGSEMSSSAALERVSKALASFGQTIVTSRLAVRGLDPAILTPFATTTDNVAPPSRMGGMFYGMVLPMLLATWAATGGTYAAIDAGAGEKERGTLEPLLTLPTSRTSLVVGKYIVVTIAAIFASFVSLLGLIIGYRVGSTLLNMQQAFQLSVSPLTLLLMFVVAIAIAATFAALELAASIYARSFKEAQTYISPIAIVMVLPGILTQALSVRDLSPSVFAVPVVNVIFSLKELVMGVVNWPHLGITLAVSGVLIVASLALAVRMFMREDVLFRS
ncbi:MAG: ABC transporter permease subunit [Chloroflexota bacterium]